MSTTSAYHVGQFVFFDTCTRYGVVVGQVEKVGRKNLTIRYLKGAGNHLFTTTVDPTVIEVTSQETAVTA